jgi:hypothetical protein
MNRRKQRFEVMALRVAHALEIPRAPPMKPSTRAPAAV